MRHRDDEVHNAGSNDATMDFFEIFEFHVDFAKPRNSTFALRTTIGIAEFDSNLCGLVSSACFPQPGTAVTLDPLREGLMWRLQYRNFGTHETLVGNFVTDVDNTDHGGIRWFELRKTAPGPWTLFQQGTHAPDANHRWMGSIAMDRQGNTRSAIAFQARRCSPRSAMQADRSSIRSGRCRLAKSPSSRVPPRRRLLRAGVTTAP